MIFLIFFITFIIITISFLSMKYKPKNKKNRTNKLPTGPQRLPIIGNLHQLGKSPHRSLKDLSRKHGGLMLLQLGSVPTLVVSSADAARDIFKNHDLVFSGRPPIYGAKKLTYNFSSITVAPYGDYWREMRRIVVLELMTTKRVQSFASIRSEEVALMISQIGSTFSDPVNLSSLAFSLSNTIVCRVAFGRAMTTVNSGSDFQEILRESQRLAGEVNVADYFPGLAWVNRFNGVDRRMEKNFQDLDRFLDRVIDEHVHLPMRPGSKDDREDIIDVLLRIQKDCDQTSTFMKDEHLKGVLIDIFVAGTDTSAVTIVWTMAELARNPTIKQKAQQEIRRIAQGKPRVEENDLPNLTYLKHVIKESLRLHPPAPLLVPRETTDTCTIGDKYEIPAKTRVLFNGLAISTDPTYWENPERFWPDRFENNEVDFRGQHFELLPFGAGRRGCPGINFSTPIVELALANLLLCFDWEIPERMKGNDIDMEEEAGIAMHKKTPLFLIATPKIE
ncbi:hypothetical protein CASFOL_013109 [Castilleja foliolosa]|uniref:Cytochrome P450 n=1 Tax=Castilleja foliolosa TaxID=1961234 RepID=A0ABD3DMV0_9LAMI